MRTTKISELPVIPEEYGNEVYENINFSKASSLMSDHERRFINGLIQYYQPRNILEVGVFKGGGTVNLLNAAAGVNAAGESSRVVSIDYFTHHWIGRTVFDNYPELVTDNWHLITGKDPSQVLCEMNIKFDFAVIDSSHFHPCETLNFISILPFLNDGAIVVVHDILIPMVKFLHRNEYFFAPRLLISSVCAEKISLNLKTDESPPNIIAFQISKDTFKYIQNVFEVLMFPWQYFDKDVVRSMSALVKKYYPSHLESLFEMAVKRNIHPRGIDLTDLPDYSSIYNCELLSLEQFDALGSNTIFYGAGISCAKLIEQCNENGKKFDFKIWAKAAESILEILNKPVTLPDYKKVADPGQKLVITIVNPDIANTVQDQFEALGYTVYLANAMYI